MQRAQAASEELGRPQLIQSMIDAMRVPDLRSKIIFTLSMLVIFRFVAHVPVPGVDTQALAQAFQSQALLGFLDLFSGGALANLSVAALGVYPYITASIVMQILTPVLPQLKSLSEEGDYGRQRINQITHWLTVPIAIMQAWGQLTILRQAGVLPSVNFGMNVTTLGIVISVYLSIGHYSGNGPSCMQDAGCGKIASSNYATMFNVPISVLGVLNYTGILGLSLIALIATRQFKLYALLGSVLLTIAGLIFSLYLTLVQPL